MSFKVALILVCLANVCFSQKFFEINPLQDGQIVEAKVDELLELRLPGNATTGYTWTVLINEQENRAHGFKHVETNYLSEEGTKMGRGGVFSVKMLPLFEGNHTVKLGYKRSWEPEPVATVTIILSVHNN